MGIINSLGFILNHPLNKTKRLDAIYRYLKWQIGSRLASGSIVFEWVNGTRFLVKPGDTGLTGNIYTGLHEFPDMSLLLDFLREEDLFIDIGSNVGSYTILACGAKKARGFAFEPIPDTYEKLKENIRLNHIENIVQAFNIGLGSAVGELSFTSSMDCMNHALSDGEIHSGAIIVKVSTLDLILKDESPTLIKIDVEGFETPVLQGAEHSLSNPSLKVVIMELNGSGSRYKYDENNILKLMKSKGFDTYSYDPFARLLCYLNGKNSESGNTIFIRDLEFVENRVKSSGLKTINGKRY